MKILEFWHDDPRFQAEYYGKNVDFHLHLRYDDSREMYLGICVFREHE